MIPPIKHRELPKPIAGTTQKIVDKSDPEFYEPMPIPSTSKPIISYVNGKPFRDYKVLKESSRTTPFVDIPHDKEAHDTRDPEAVSELNKEIKNNKLSPLERRLKKKEDKKQKEW